MVLVENVPVVSPHDNEQEPFRSMGVQAVVIWGTREPQRDENLVELVVEQATPLRNSGDPLEQAVDSGASLGRRLGAGVVIESRRESDVDLGVHVSGEKSRLDVEGEQLHIVLRAQGEKEADALDDSDGSKGLVEVDSLLHAETLDDDADLLPSTAFCLEDPVHGNRTPTRRQLRTGA